MSELPSPTSAPQASHAASGLSLGRRMSAAFARTIRDDGWFLVFLAMISLGLGFLCAAKWEKAEWTAKATLRVGGQPLQIHSGHPAGATLLVTNALNALGTPEKLEALNAALGQSWTADEWSLQGKRAFAAIGENTTLQWTAQDKQAALQAVEWISQQVMSSAEVLAMELHEKELAEWSSRIAKMEARLAVLNKEQGEFQKKKGFTDVKGDLAHLADSLTSLEYQLRLDNQAEVGAKEEYKEVLRQLDAAKRTMQSTLEREAEERSHQVSEKDLVKRRQILLDAIQAEKVQLEQKALLENKTNEKKQLEVLAAQGKASQEGVLRLATEIEVLKTKMAGNGKIVDLENELKMLDQTDSPNQERKSKQPTSQVIVTLLDKKMEMELKMLRLAQEMVHLRGEIAAAKTRRDQIQASVGDDDKFREERDRLIKEKGNLESKRDQVMMDGPQRALQVEWIQTPTVGEQPVSTNRYPLFSSAFLACSLLGFLGVFSWELRRN